MKIPTWPVGVHAGAWHTPAGRFLELPVPADAGSPAAITLPLDLSANIARYQLEHRRDELGRDWWGWVLVDHAGAGS